MNLRRLPSLFVALFLQFSPLARTIQPALSGLLQPIAILLRLASAASAVAGGSHALAAVSGLQSASPVKATNGLPFSYQIQISSAEYGPAQSYSVDPLTPLPTGIVFDSKVLGTLKGTPNVATVGPKVITVIGWEFATTSGHNLSVSLTINVIAGAPIITADPLSPTVTEGNNAILSVSVKSDGTTPTYQWIKDGVDIPGQTNPSIQFTPAKLSDKGSYTCRVRSSGGLSTTSKAGVLTVNPAAIPPVIHSFVAGPSAHLHAGETLTLTVNATAAGTLGYQWFNGVSPVASTVLPQLVLPAVAAGNAGSYTVKATANALSTTSDPVVVVVGAPLAAGKVAPDGTGTTVAFDAIVGRHYFLESAAQPDATSWSPATDVVAATPAGLLVDPVAAGAAPRFYRLRVQ